MGALCSSAPVEVMEQPSGNPELVFSAKAWEKDFPAITSTELKRRREEFWDTRVEGRKEAWQAIKLACEAGDEGTSLAILDSAGLTPFDMNKPDCCFCYDDHGAKYEVPMYVLRDPANVVKTDEHNHSSQADAAASPAQQIELQAQPSSAVAPIITSGGGGGDEKSKNQSASPVASPSISPVSPMSPTSPAPISTDNTPGFKIKIRFSEGKDIEVTVRPSQSIKELKTQLFASNAIPIKDQRVIYSGRRLEDNDTMMSAKIKPGIIVQVMVVHIPS
jgi:hypothetical protein